MKRQKSLDIRRNYTAKARKEEQHIRYESCLEISICGKKTKRGINGECLESEGRQEKKKSFKNPQEMQEDRNTEMFFH